MSTAVAGVVLLAVVFGFGSYRVVHWWNHLWSPSPSLTASSESPPKAPTPDDSFETDMRDERMALAASSIKTAGVPVAVSPPAIPTEKTAPAVIGPALVPTLTPALPPGVSPTAAGAMPDLATGVAAPPTAADIAMRPSLKYHRLTVSTAATGGSALDDAARSVPLVTFSGPFAGVSAPQSPANNPKPQQPSAADADKALQALINSNLDMEEARKFVMSMCYDLRGRLWVGTEGGGIQCFDTSAPELHQWTQFTTKDGLGDNNGYAIACDRLGRIWVGHLNHGVSVYNGQKWQNYEVVGGISTPTSLSGPLGERIFSIKVCPTDGDVWMATSCGLARYSESKQNWSYYTRAEGLPSDQVQAIAFGPEGDIYVGTQCDGIAIARARDGHKSWTTVTGPEELPTTPTGSGLPTNLINDILVAHDGTVYAATTAGMAWSRDKGTTWQFIRGKDWADKVRGSYVGPPTGWQETPGALLAEDYITSVAEEDNGGLWVGYRQRGAQLIHLQQSQFVAPIQDGVYATSLVEIGRASIIMGTYGGGTRVLASALIALSSSQSLSAAALPLGAAAPDSEGLRLIASQLAGKSTRASAKSAYLGQDWATHGDWVGRIGRQYAILFAGQWPFDRYVSHGAIFYNVGFDIGPHHDPKDCIRRWISSRDPTSLTALYDPFVGHRVQSEIDDHGEAYAAERDGPDLYLWVKVTEGKQAVSLYFVNEDGHVASSRYRDYLIRVSEAQQLGVRSASPAGAKARVANFWGGVYERFLVQGPGIYQFEIQRNHSFNTICSGIFIDSVSGPSTFVDAMPLPSMGDVRYDLPKPAAAETADKMAEPAKRLWDLTLDSKPENLGIEGEARILAYRIAAQVQPNVDPSLLSSWRWKLRLWTKQDRAEFSEVMKKAWVAYIFSITK